MTGVETRGSLYWMVHNFRLKHDRQLSIRDSQPFGVVDRSDVKFARLNVVVWVLVAGQLLPVIVVVIAIVGLDEAVVGKRAGFAIGEKLVVGRK